MPLALTISLVGGLLKGYGKPRHGNCTIEPLEPVLVGEMHVDLQNPQDVNTAFEVQRPDDKTAVVIIPDIFAEASQGRSCFCSEKYCSEVLI